MWHHTGGMPHQVGMAPRPQALSSPSPLAPMHAHPAIASGVGLHPMSQGSQLSAQRGEVSLALQRQRVLANALRAGSQTGGPAGPPTTPIAHQQGIPGYR